MRSSRHVAFLGIIKALPVTLCTPTAVGAVGLGCAAVATDAPGAVMLALTTDAPADASSLTFDRVKVVVESERGSGPRVRTYSLAPRDLPATLTIAAKPGQGGVVTRIGVFAFEGESTLRVYRSARIVLPPTGIEMLRMPLNVACDRVYPAGICPPDQSCGGAPSTACGAAETCADGRCEAVEVPEGRLPAYSSGAEAVCSAEGPASQCARAAKACGTLTSANNCGEVKTVDCGRCADAGARDAAPTFDSGPSCGPGTYASGPSCDACAPGTYSNTTNAPSCTPWKTCSAGQYVASAGNDVADRVCMGCGAGTYSSATNATSCIPCGAGTTSPAGASSCTAVTNEVGATTASLTGPGLSDCGVQSNDVCARSQLVTGGTFYRGTTTSYRATISDFRLDKYEVTVGRFRKFVNAWLGGWRPTAGSGKHTHVSSGTGLANTSGGTEPGWDATWTGYVGARSVSGQPSGPAGTTNAVWDTALNCDSTYMTWTSAAGSNEKRPQNCLSWYDLHAFCIWDGGFLPSEAEWEYAAAGGSEERTYPWGATEPAANTSLAIYGCYFNGSGTCSGVTNIAPVGSVPAGASKAGQLDLAGNMWEWVLDSHQALTAACTDCANRAAFASRTVRGGTFEYPANIITAAYRDGCYNTPGSRANSYGGRCARIP